MTSRKDRNIQFSEFAGQFGDQVNNADTLRAESLQRLHDIRSKRQTSQRRQLRRLATKFGKEHPRVLRQAERIANENEMRNYLSATIARAGVETEIIKDGFIFQGRVLADNVRGLPGLVVQLQDIRSNRIGRPGKTDKDGFFSVLVDVDASFSRKKASVIILDRRGTQIHKEKLPVLLRPDSIESRDIVISKIGRVNRVRNAIIKEEIKTGKPAVSKKKITGKGKVSTKKTTVSKSTKKSTSKVSRKVNARKPKGKPKVASPDKKRASRKKVAAKKKATKKKATKKTAARKPDSA